MSKDKQEYGPVDASPVKSFFVSMLTRDIKLEDSILDLLDNCVDGILRSGQRHSKKTPYAKYWAKIEFNRDSFTITDNCGGIPWNLHDYAFRLGRSKDRPSEAPGTVGIYGIGMKRAIFKMGRHCLIETKNGKDAYDVEITPEWINAEEDWKIPVKQSKKKSKEDGTTIYVGKLYQGISQRFSDDVEAFKADLNRMIASHYAYILDKGFSVTINGESVKPRPTKLIFQKLPKNKNRPGIQPFIFRTKTSDGVEVFLAVGFTRPIPSQNEIVEEQEGKKYSSLDAGWTILCNDRAVVYCDRTELTGWGEAGVPRYHNQFIAISGVVEFRSTDASKLPTTTTKRGIDASSPLYLQVKNKMREGMNLFVDYTNKWKDSVDVSRKQIEGGKPLSFYELKNESKRLSFHSTKKSTPSGEQYKPTLPYPKKLELSKRRISFTKSVQEVREVAEFLFEDDSTDASTVGEGCFNFVLDEARK